MKPTWYCVFSLFVLACLAGSLLAQDTPTDTSQREKARVFITDSQSWEIAGAEGGSGAGFGGATRGGARPQTAEIIKTFGERCPSVMVNNIQQKADYIVLLDHEGGKGFLRHRNKVAVFARVSGDSIVSKSTLSLGGSVQEACEAIVKDWSAHGSAIRAAAAEGVAPSEKPALVPAAQSENAVGTKVSIASNPSAADIEIDGSFAGNTPSTIELAAGEHTVSISKTGFKTWERKVKVSGGTININAELESKQ
jgi:RNase P/RNase MRP subunit p29